MARNDPAETDSLLRFFYKDWRPTRLAKIWNRFMAWLSGLGLMPTVLLTLQVKNRRDGRVYPTVLAVAHLQGKQYIVSMLGDGSEWVQDVLAAGGEVLIKRGRSRRVLLTAIEPAQRAPILKAWCQVATSGRKHLPVQPDAPLPAFEAIADDYPVFRIDPAP